ncbi:MAG TPA: choice-of-anchor P family protein [Ktedonobacteraceae bacterium]|nr:choice-of-anchor P family protein [Ktedonobacteraceae bacterium]
MMKRFSIFVVLIAALLICFQTTISSPVNAASSVNALGSGYGFGGYAEIPAGSGMTTSGPFVPAWFGCQMDTLSTGSSASNMNVSSYSTSGAAQTSITNTQDANGGTVQTTTNVNNLNMLSGLITASSIHSAVASTIDAVTASSRVVDEAFNGLVVAGQPIGVNPGPNTTIQLANVGNVVLNEYGNPTNGSDSTYIGVNMIDLRVTQNNFYGLPIGTQIIIGQANSGEQRMALRATVSGNSYGFSSSSSSGQPSGSGGIGPITAAQLPCTGGSSQDSAAASSYPGIGSLGASTANTSGQITSTMATATNSASVQNTNLFNGLINGDQMSATANASWDGSGSGSATTKLTNVTIAGLPVSASPPPNTQRPLPGIGYVVLNEQSGTANASGAAESVNAMDIVVTTANAFKLPVGTHIILGHAEAGANGLA